MGRLFGTDGVRGVANTELTSELAYKLGRYGAIVLAGETKHKPRILVGSDTRISCPMLESAMVAGICSAGADALVCGVIPTPGIAKLVKMYDCDAGVVISASHNSFEFNGIKFFSSEGFKLPDRIEDEIEKAVNDPSSCDDRRPSGTDVGHRIACSCASSDYANELKKAFDIDLHGMRIALDCANGATSFIAPELFAALGAEVFTSAASPDGTNINHRCGSTHPEGLCDLVRENRCDAGFAFDGDGDRMLAVDEDGSVIDGDVIMAIIADHMKRHGELNNETLVVTVMSNLGLDIFAAEHGIKLAKTKVGDRYVLEEMVAQGHSIGGEQSGHIILLSNTTTGDGMLSALKLLQVICDSGVSLKDSKKIMKVLPQVLKGVKVSNGNKEAVMNDPEILSKCAEIETELAGRGRVLVRASGTEPLIRVMLEGEDTDKITESCDFIISMISDKYN
ncbi:MAG: phosphoglucosamine mutase [Eubacteriales bacterium]|nr:phosphoglucosamine mutase [Eubacteriales bacterium]MDD4716887.1 phosphoglucosamine mutase [Eubacteriales bacterium]